MIKVSGLVKTFSKVNVVNNLSFEIGDGTIFGLLGPNGAGKTTLIRMMCGILKSDAGEVSINGLSVEKAKQHFGYVSQSFGQYEELTVWENIRFYAQMYGVNNTKKLDFLLSRYNLSKYRDFLAGTLSGGYKRRLALACALAHDPSVLFLDEPTAGIDPVTRKLLWDDFYALSMEGKTLFITTHYMEEAQRCNELAFLALGNIVAKGTPKTIKKALGNIKLYTVEIDYTPLITEYLSGIDGIILLNQFGDELRIMVRAEFRISAIEEILKDKLNSTNKLQEGSANLEDVFIALTQESNS
ncbi:MAG: ABC transporter ATP-binding protein [Sulfurimonas sp.]|nr:ABC transporter ATP-binding protein [Sulfurimonas sp.]